MIDAAGGLMSVMVRFAAVTATTGALGAWAFVRFVLPRLANLAGENDRAEWRILATRIAVWSTAIVAITALWRTQLPNAGFPRAADGVTNLFQSVTWAYALHAQGVVAGIAALLLAFRTKRGAPWSIDAETCVVALALVAPALAHAGSASELRLIAFAVDIAHGLSAAAWVGALAIVTRIAAQTRTTERGGSTIAALFVAFHPVALIAAPVVFLTGLATAWLRMGVPEGIANPTYSGLFVAKLLLAGVVGYFGAAHSKVATKRLTTVAPGAVWQTLLAECAFALAVLFLTALLVGTPPIG